jgi:hypothetical protein
MNSDGSIVKSRMRLLQYGAGRLAGNIVQSRIIDAAAVGLVSFITRLAGKFVSSMIMAAVAHQFLFNSWLAGSIVESRIIDDVAYQFFKYQAS